MALLVQRGEIPTSSGAMLDLMAQVIAEQSLRELQCRHHYSFQIFGTALSYAGLLEVKSNSSAALKLAILFFLFAYYELFLSFGSGLPREVEVKGVIKSAPHCSIWYSRYHGTSNLYVKLIG